MNFHDHIHFVKSLDSRFRMACYCSTDWFCFIILCSELFTAIFNNVGTVIHVIVTTIWILRIRDHFWLFFNIIFGRVSIVTIRGIRCNWIRVSEFGSVFEMFGTLLSVQISSVFTRFSEISFYQWVINVWACLKRKQQ